MPLPSASNEAGASAAHPYEVIIQPQTRFVGNEDRQCRLQSGMEGRADIISPGDSTQVHSQKGKGTNGSVIQSNNLLL